MRGPQHKPTQSNTPLYLGSFDTPVDAAVAYARFVKKVRMGKEDAGENDNDGIEEEDEVEDEGEEDEVEVMLEGEPPVDVDHETGEDMFRVERLLAERRRHGRVEYLVRWLGWPPEHDSWEPARNIKDEDLAAALCSHAARQGIPSSVSLELLVVWCRSTSWLYPIRL